MDLLKNMVSVALLTLFCLLLPPLAQAAAAQPGPVVSETEMRRIFNYLETNVPEIGDMARQGQAGKLVMSIDAEPDPSAEERFDKEFYHIYVGFNIQYESNGASGIPGHRTRWATFLVHRNLNEILWANYARGNTYVPLEDWRRYVNGIDAKKTNDFVCIPYMRAGRIESFSTIEDIIRLYGAEQVEKRMVYGPEGIGRFDVSVIYPNTANELLVFWDQNDYGKRPSSVSMRKAGSNWHTLYGVKIGTTLEELNQLNGRPFKFLGFNWDYGGSVKNNWEDGRLLTLRPASITLRAQSDLPRQYQGDRLLLSDTENLLVPERVWVGRIDVPLK